MPMNNTKMGVGGGAGMPRFGPRMAAAPTKNPNAALSAVADILSRPVRARRSGYTKTSTVKGGAAPGGAPGGLTPGALPAGL